MVLEDSALWEPGNDPGDAFSLVPEVGNGAPRIKVVGIGGGGSNAVSRMFKEKLPVVEYYAVNTDAQHLFRCDVAHRLSIGQSLTRGLGAGASPDLGRQAAEESRLEIEKAMEGADMVFLAVGMGGGTGTGASPIVAQVAKECGALTVAVVSRPFAFEASTRRKNADEGINRLKDHVDTLIVIPNDRLLQLNNHGEQTFTWEDALKMADSVLQQAIQAIAEVVTVPGEINVDFADVKTILNNAGPAWLAIGRGKGENRAVEAAKMATKSPLLDIAMDGAKRILFVVSGGPTLSLQEVQDAANVIQEMADPDANIIFGTCRDSKLDDEVKITMVAAAFPMLAETQQMREAELERLLQDVIPESEEELDVPSFLRRQSGTRGRGFFR
ncbi:MAG: cell division protein FtsZ [Dehalococcoidia bacterium]|jgi:cell division protein FtsZ|nr:cell division protein FtsZ [Dehalococcoidia bacterium]MDP7083585.1 cell division protein FtsZ [Dehalococcoidia bacterium]MDP7199598.1 cell division protein FtsZ [Dehalococcoidia bacterium]MDP7511613.1 cell division protein FtsZ [Dehalococcoidia bacterium]|tara:strand:+ start:252 stop:1406 length:1155 start_codon:yes stop_codon:yes gene_type:complete